jgi:hypothetical protein
VSIAGSIANVTVITEARLFLSQLQRTEVADLRSEGLRAFTAQDV